MDTKLFKAGVTVDGDYVHGKQYDILTQVYYNPATGGDGCSYVSRVPNKNVRPGTDDTVWVLSSRGISWAGFYCARHGETASRPSLTTTEIGYLFFDTTLGKVIVWSGTEWINLDGTSLSE